MFDRDLIQDASHTPTYEEIFNYMDEYTQRMWQDVNSFIQNEYNASPKIMYSKCSGKPGWNIKYKKSGKSLCTLYPEKHGFVTLVVITLDLVPMIESLSHEFDEEVLELMKTAKPFNGTLWLMIQVHNFTIVDNIKHLLVLKSTQKKS
ncbi:DUF3788 domain-containing protein [Brassicibacter mesophilus]|uniref:DUF3788 domain-containing protein n=1 Tax=Brassicibacter mesophilus TaxID=745119 RepID=UPI003D255091